MSTASTSSNSERKAELLAEIIEGASNQLKLAKELAKELKARKPRATTGESRGSAWTSWTSQCKTLFPEAYDTHVKGLPPNDKGKQPTNDIMGFATKARNSTHIAEWTEFEAKWSEEHPKPAKAAKVKAPKATKVVKAAGGAGAPPASDADSSDSEAPSAKASPAASKASKKSAPASPAASASSKKSAKPSKATPLPAATPAPEEAKPKAKRLTKAEKEAAAAAAAKASEAAAASSPPTPYTYRGKAYLKNEHNQVWTVGADGSVGDWHGLMSADGKKLEKSDGPV